MKFMRLVLAVLAALAIAAAVKFIFWVSAFTGMLAAFEPPVTVGNDSVLTLDFTEVIADAPSNDPLAAIDLMNLSSVRRVSLFDALRAIETAADDNRIRGICIRPAADGGPESWAVAEELRTAIDEFRRSGKFVVAYNESYSQPEYYLASVADRLYIEPMGEISWHGLAFTNIFYKGLLDKLGIEAEVFRPAACNYKSAVEPYILDRMSDDNRRQMQQLADDMWGTIAADVAASRNMSVARLNELTDSLAVCEAADAVRNGFADGAIYEDEFEDEIAGLSGTRDWQSVTLGEYASSLRASSGRSSRQVVAVVYAEGDIVEGYGGPSRGDEHIYGGTLAARLADLADDRTVKAVVLRVNSPGGSALAADVVWREMQLLREVKPVVVSMGAYAASGGYYIAAPADVIVADRLTLTGSIGVFGLALNPAAALRDKLGITFDGVKSNASADIYAPGHTLTAAERASLMRSVDRFYGHFTRLVAEGRNLPTERVQELAQGRVWSGAAADSLGLADACGGLKSAIAIAASKAGLTDFRVEECIDEPQGVAALFATLRTSVRQRILHAEFPEFPEYCETVKRLRQVAGRNGVMMYSDVRIEL